MGHTVLQHTKLLTYSDLFKCHLDSLGNPTSNSALTQQIKNIKATLLRFLLHHAKTLEDPIGVEFSIEFDKSTENYLNTSGLSSSSIPSKRSHLKKLHTTYLELLNQLAMPKEFHKALAYLMKSNGYNPNRLANAIGVKCPKTIKRWMEGDVIPRIEAHHIIVKIEKLFCLQSGALVSLLPAVNKKMDRIRKTTAYGQRASINSSKCYYLKKFPEKLQKQWDVLYEFKTSIVPPDGKERHYKSRWRLRDPLEEYYIHESRLKSFFGYLTLSQNSDPSLNGKGIPLEKLDFIQFLKTKYVEDYIEFGKIRSGGIYNGNVNTFVSFVKMLTNPKHGFIIQHPELFPDIPVTELKDMVEKAHVRYLTYLMHIKPFLKKSRNPIELSDEIIKTSHPLDILIKTGHNIEAYTTKKWSCRTINKSAALDFRDDLILNMLISNPLRSKNYRRMMYKKDNTGHLRKYADGSWWLEIPKEEFKNEAGAAGDTDYKVMVNKNLWSKIEYYLCQCRPILLGNNSSDLFLLTNHGTQFKVNNFNVLISKLTHSFCPIKNAGFGPHEFRHIIATDYIKNHPNGFQVVANILHDRLYTVIKNYSHLVAYDGFKYWDDYFNQRTDAVKHIGNNYDC